MLSMALYAVYFLCTTSSCNPPLGHPQHQHNAPNTRPQTLCGVCSVCAMYAGFASCMCCVSCLCCILGHGWPGADSIGRGGIPGRCTEWGAGGWGLGYRGVQRSCRKLPAPFGRGPPGCGAAANEGGPIPIFLDSEYPSWQHEEPRTRQRSIHPIAHPSSR